ncbi:MAG: ABC transporter substrate-binding protein [Candidatus Woesearchaeota archaeon]|nr:ABC transporter substrate-binding protein [Candidatus Woesearchaeota archaeon]
MRYLLVLLFLVSCTPVDNTIEIGAILTLSGSGAHWGEGSQQGAELAVQEINAAGGVNGKQLRISYEDNRNSDGKNAVAALRKLLYEDKNIILGPTWTPPGLAIAPIACEEQTLMISPTLGVAEFNELCDTNFNLWLHDFLISEELGQYLYDKGYRKIAIVSSLQAWEQEQAYAVKRGYERAGGTVAAFELADKNEMDYLAEATKITMSDPDAVVFTNIAFQHITAKRLHELGEDAPFYSVLMDDERIKGADGAFENTVVITSFTPSDEFKEKFRATYGKEADLGSDTAYDAIHLLARAMRATNSEDTVQVAAHLNTVRIYTGASGTLVFDGKGGVTKEPKYMVVKNGKLAPLSSISFL